MCNCVFRPLLLCYTKSAYIRHKGLTYRNIFHKIHCTSRDTLFLAFPICFINVPETNLVHVEPVVNEQQVFPPVVLTLFLSSVAVGFPKRPGTESAEESGVEQ